VTEGQKRLSAVDRRALTAVAMQFFVNGMLGASFASRLPELRDQVDVRLSTFGTLMTIGVGSGLIGSAIAGRVINRFGTRRVLGVGSAGLVLTLPLIGASTGPMQMVTALAIFMVFDVLVDIAMNLQGSWISARRRVPVINRLHGLWSLGTVTGGLVAARSAAEGVPLFTHLTGASVAVAVLAYIVFRGLLKSDEEETLPPTGVSSGRTPTRSVSTSLLVMLGFGGGFAVIMEFVGSDWAAFRLSDDLGASPGLATLGYVAFTSGMTIARYRRATRRVQPGEGFCLEHDHIGVGCEFVGDRGARDARTDDQEVSVSYGLGHRPGERAATRRARPEGSMIRAPQSPRPCARPSP
jgi:MFS family permease